MTGVQTCALPICGILTHGIPALHHAIAGITERVGGAFGWLLPPLLDGLSGIVAGVLALLVVSAGQRLWSRRAAQPA